MAITSLNSRWLIFALPLLGAVSGCWCQAFPLPGESSCPTDARRIYCGAGEEAIRRCPCGPGSEFYGHKPTDWRPWPEGWRYGQYPCSAPSGESGSMEPMPTAPAGAAFDFPNPFRNMDAPEAWPATAAPAETPPTDQHADDAGAPNFAPAKPTPPETAPVENHDLKNAAPADAAAQPAPLELPPAVATPPRTAPAPTATTTEATTDAAASNTAPAPAPPAAAVPADSAPPASPPADTDENKSSSAKGSRLQLIAAQNAPPHVDVPSSGSAQPPVAVVPAKVPATAWSAPSKAKPMKAGADEPPVSKRVAEHLTHNVLN